MPQVHKRRSRASFAATAHHEAAHAVAAVVLDLGLGEVSIEGEEDDELGFVRVDSPLKTWRWGDGPRRPLLDRYLISLYAGREGERIALGAESIGYWGDYEKAQYWLEQVGVPGAQYVGDDSWEAYKKRLQRRAAVLVEENVTAIRALARTLLAVRRLPPDKAVAIVRTALKRSNRK